MKDLTYADKTVLLGDEAADLIIELSALLAETGHADSVTLNAIDSQGGQVVASFVLGSGTNVMAETSMSSLPEPDNGEGIRYMRQKIRFLLEPHKAHPETEPWTTGEDFDLPPDGLDR